MPRRLTPRQLFKLFIVLDIMFAIGVIWYFFQPDSASDEKTFPAQVTNYVDVIIAVDELPRGLTLTESLISGEKPVIGIRQVAESAKPDNAIDPALLPELVNTVVRTDIPRESILVTDDLLVHPVLGSTVSLPSHKAFAEHVTPLTGDFVETPITTIFPAGLAGGDTVDIVVSSGEQVELWRETVMVADVVDGQPHLWLTADDGDALTALINDGASVTLLLRAVGDSSSLGETIITLDDLNAED